MSQLRRAIAQQLRILNSAYFLHLMNDFDQFTQVYPYLLSCFYVNSFVFIFALLFKAFSYRKSIKYTFVIRFLTEREWWDRDSACGCQCDAVKVVLMHHPIIHHLRVHNQNFSALTPYQYQYLSDLHSDIMFLIIYWVIWVTLLNKIWILIFVNIF